MEERNEIEMWLEAFDIYNKIPLDENELEKYLEELKTIEEERKDIEIQYKRICSQKLTKLKIKIGTYKKLIKIINFNIDLSSDVYILLSDIFSYIKRFKRKYYQELFLDEIDFKNKMLNLNLNFEVINLKLNNNVDEKNLFFTFVKEFLTDFILLCRDDAPLLSYENLNLEEISSLNAKTIKHIEEIYQHVFPYGNINDLFLDDPNTNEKKNNHKYQLIKIISIFIPIIGFFFSNFFCPLFLSLNTVLSAIFFFMGIVFMISGILLFFYLENKIERHYYQEYRNKEKPEIREKYLYIFRGEFLEIYSNKIKKWSEEQIKILNRALEFYSDEYYEELHEIDSFYNPVFKDLDKREKRTSNKYKRYINKFREIIINNIPEDTRSLFVDFDLKTGNNPQRLQAFIQEAKIIGTRKGLFDAYNRQVEDYKQECYEVEQIKLAQEQIEIANWNVQERQRIETEKRRFLVEQSNKMNRMLEEQSKEQNRLLMEQNRLLQKNQEDLLKVGEAFKPLCHSCKNYSCCMAKFYLTSPCGAYVHK